MEPFAKTPFVTVREAAGLLKVSDRTIRRWIASEKLPCVKTPSGRHRIPRTLLFVFVRNSDDPFDELTKLDERFFEITEEQVRSALQTSDIHPDAQENTGIVSSGSTPLPEGWGQTLTGEPMPDVAAAVRRSREEH